MTRAVAIWRMLRRPALLAGLPALGLVAGLLAVSAGKADLAAAFWIAGTVPVLAVLLATIVRSLRAGDVGLDVIAALAMASAIVGGEHLAAAVVALMFAGGQALEDYAQGRARAEMTALLARVPRTAEVHRNGRLVTEAVDALLPGDRVLVRTGDVVPADGRVAAGTAVLDESSVTGEPLPVTRRVGESVASGVTNAGPPFDLDVTTRAAESTYAAIVRMVEAARLSKAPMARLADRYALVFLAATLAIAGAAWLISGDPRRIIAVLVVATPCPLILAVPVAIVAGMSRCAGRGVMVKAAATLEKLPRIRTLLVDKTGTLTGGRPSPFRVEPPDGMAEREFVRLAASLAQASRHVVSEALTADARARGLALATPTDAREAAGDGVAGTVDGRSIRIGRRAYAEKGNAPSSTAPAVDLPPGVTALWVSVDGAAPGRILFADTVRPESAGTLRAMRALGIRRTVLLTGDGAEVAERVGADLGVDAVIAEATPEAKVAVVRAERAKAPTMMVGDGINDAPALASADVGVALGARGAAAASEAADMVVMVDRLDRIVEAVAIARRTLAIARQSVLIGIGLSLVGMAAAALGWLEPVAGALMQEAIDLAAVLNALRALGGGVGFSAEPRESVIAAAPDLRLGLRR